MKKIGTIFLLLCLVVFPLNAEETTNEETPLITCTTSALEMDIHSGMMIPCTIQNAAKGAVITYGSSNSEVVSIDNTGLIKAHKKGEAEISITVEDKLNPTKNTIKVRVNDNNFEFSFNHNSIYVNKYATIALGYTASDNVQKSDIVWSSSNPDVATVENGVVTGISKGYVTITAQIGEIIDTININVIVPLEELYFNPQTILLNLKETASVPDLIFVPYDASYANDVYYEVEDSNIVSLENGVITGLKVGTTKIFAYVDEVVAVLEVSVKYEVTETNAIMLDFEYKEKKESTIEFQLPKLDDETLRLSLNLDSSDLVTFLEEQKEVSVILNLGTVDFKNIESIEIADTIIKQFKDHKVSIILNTEKKGELARFIFMNSTESPVNLNFLLRSTNSLDRFEQRIDGLAYRLYFNSKTFPSGTVFLLNANLINSRDGQLQFVYKVVGNDSLELPGEEIKINEQNQLIFSLSAGDFIIAFNKVGNVGTDKVIYILLGIIGVGGVFTGIYFVRNKKKKETML